MVLFLNDIGTWEVLLILVFVLIFFGSKSIPGLARTLGRTIRQIKDASDEIQSEIRKSGNQMRKDLNLKEMIEETAEDIRRPLDQHAQDLEQAMTQKTRLPKGTADKKKSSNTENPVKEDPASDSEVNDDFNAENP